MAYNGGFPVTYQPYPQYQPQIAQPAPQPIQQPAPAPTNNLIWVQGEAGAKSYLLTPNTTLPLWDSEAQTIYLKSADASGMPTMKILDYTIREQAQSSRLNTVAEPVTDYVTHKELSELREEITSKIDELTTKRAKSKKEDAE